MFNVSNMFPRLSIHYHRDVGLVGIKSLRQTVLRNSTCVQLADFSYRLFRQLCHVVGRPHREPGAMFSIAHIVCLGSGIKMVWSNARRIVTAVQYQEAVWDRSVTQLKRIAMSSDKLNPVPHGVKRAVAALSPLSLPRPAFSHHVHILPKTEFRMCLAADAVTWRGAVFPPCLTWFCQEDFLASQTTNRYFNSNHDLNLRHRLGLWSGSLTAETVDGPFAF